MEKEEEPHILSVLVNSKSPLDVALASQKISSIVEQKIPENFDGEVRQKLRLLDTSGGPRTAQLSELALGLISNNAMPEEGVRLFLDWLMKHSHKSTLGILNVDTHTVKAVSTGILETVAKNGDKSALDFLLKSGIQRSCLSGAEGGRLLQIAAHAGATEVAKVLVDNGADINPDLAEIDEVFGLPPLHHAVHENQPGLVNYLLKNGAQVDFPGNDEVGTAFSYAVKLECLECASLLLEAGADVDTCDVSYYRDEVLFDGELFLLNALGYSLLTGSPEIYELLLTRSKKAKTSATIHGVLCAATDGVEKLKAYLEERPQAIGWRRKAILEEALVHSYYFSSREDAIDTLLDFRVDPNVPTYEIEEEFPLLYATARGLSHVKHLLDAGAKVNNEAAIIRAASEMGNLDILDFLIRKGANLDSFGNAALESAVQANNLAAIKLLRAFGVDLKKCRDMTQIHMVAECGSSGIMEYFLRHGMDPNVPPDSNGLAPLHYAVRQ